MKKSKRRLSKVTAFAAALVSAGTMMTSALPLTASADGNNDYSKALALSLYFFDANECGSGVNDGPLTWRGNCHTEDGKLLLSNATNFDNSYRSLVDPDGDGKVDMSGGYHDAGDHIKFNLTMGFGFSSLAMAEYLNPGAYEKAGCKDHLLSICKKNADYMMKSTFLDNNGEVATICYVVADGGADHSMMTPPEEQHYDRASYWLTKNSNNSACCGEMAAALAGCAYLYQNTDAEYSRKCLKYAKAIYNFGKNHTGNYSVGQAPYYSTNDDSQDELLLASAWLYICGEGSQPSTKPSNGNYNGKYDCYRYTWDKVYQGYAALMYKKTNDYAFKQELEYEVNNAGGLYAGKYNGDGWGAARYNCGLQMTGYAAANGDKNNSLVTGAKWQMDYILGNNPLGYSFLLGYGNKWPTHIHHRAANPGNLANNPAAKYTLYGCLVGGIDASGNYEDHSDKYQYTEGALDYNGCFALACAPLVNMFGSNGNGAADVVNSASEFKKNYSFGNNNTQPPINNDAYPAITNVEYNEKYHQIKFTWSPVENATNYGIAVQLAGKWRVQTQNISPWTTTYTTPKNLTPGKSYRVAIAAKVNGVWTVEKSTKHAVTVTVR